MENIKPYLVIGLLIVSFVSVTLWFDQEQHNAKPIVKAKIQDNVIVNTNYKTTLFENVAPEPSKEPIEAMNKKLNYDGPIESVFVRTVITYPSKAFISNSDFGRYAITVSELEKILGSLYDKGFILVSLSDLYDTKTLEKKELKLPENKKPILFSIDDISYNKYKVSRGAVEKISLDGKQKNVISVVNAFVDSHPNFSYHGAKGIIEISGSENVMGYSFHDEKEKTAIQMLAAQLKRGGWQFASAGFSKLDASKATAKQLREDLDQWRTIISPLVGETPIYIYPEGAEVSEKDLKMNVITRYGYKILLSEDKKTAVHKQKNTLTVERRHLDGLAITDQRKSYRDLFDAKLVIDPLRK